MKLAPMTASQTRAIVERMIMYKWDVAVDHRQQTKQQVVEGRLRKHSETPSALMRLQVSATSCTTKLPMLAKGHLIPGTYDLR